jgi:hypothetical protein
MLWESVLLESIVKSGKWIQSDSFRKEIRALELCYRAHLLNRAALVTSVVLSIFQQFYRVQKNLEVRLTQHSVRMNLNQRTCFVPGPCLYISLATQMSFGNGDGKTA